MAKIFFSCFLFLCFFFNNILRFAVVDCCCASRRLCSLFLESFTIFRIVAGRILRDLPANRLWLSFDSVAHVGGHHSTLARFERSPLVRIADLHVALAFVLIETRLKLKLGALRLWIAATHKNSDLFVRMVARKQ